jgi:hypothetical protein
MAGPQGLPPRPTATTSGPSGRSARGLTRICAAGTPCRRSCPGTCAPAARSAIASSHGSARAAAGSGAWPSGAARGNARWAAAAGPAAHVGRQEERPKELAGHMGYAGRPLVRLVGQEHRGLLVHGSAAAAVGAGALGPAQRAVGDGIAKGGARGALWPRRVSRGAFVWSVGCAGRCLIGCSGRLARSGQAPSGGARDAARAARRQPKQLRWRLERQPRRQRGHTTPLGRITTPTLRRPAAGGAAPAAARTTRRTRSQATRRAGPGLGPILRHTPSARAARRPAAGRRRPVHLCETRPTQETCPRSRSTPRPAPTANARYSTEDNTTWWHPPGAQRRATPRTGAEPPSRPAPKWLSGSAPAGPHAANSRPAHSNTVTQNGRREAPVASTKTLQLRRWRAHTTLQLRRCPAHVNTAAAPP